MSGRSQMQPCTLSNSPLLTPVVTPQLDYTWTFCDAVKPAWVYGSGSQNNYANLLTEINNLLAAVEVTDSEHPSDESATEHDDCATDESFMAARRAKLFSDEQLIAYLAKSHSASNERKVHCFFEFLEVRLARQTRGALAFLEKINPDSLSDDVAAGIAFFVRQVPQKYSDLRDGFIERLNGSALIS